MLSDVKRLTYSNLRHTVSHLIRQRELFRHVMFLHTFPTYFLRATVKDGHTHFFHSNSIITKRHHPTTSQQSFDTDHRLCNPSSVCPGCRETSREAGSLTQPCPVDKSSSRGHCGLGEDEEKRTLTPTLPFPQPSPLFLSKAYFIDSSASF